MPTYAAFVPAATAVSHTSSSLLAATPPAVAKVLSQAYPFILLADRTLALLTWTDEDPYKSFLLIIVWSLFVNYFEIFVRYFAQIGLALGVVLTVYATKAYGPGDVHPSLDTIVHTLSNVAVRFNLLVLPLTSLELSSRDLTRLAFTAFFMTPLYITVTQFFLSVRQVVLLTGILFLSYNSMWARVTRAILWRWKLVRLLMFYWTGVDFSRTVSGVNSGRAGELSRNQSSTELATLDTGARAAAKPAGKHVRFTYVLYENQRRWLGIGWTSNMLAYERAPWTDEFLNESSSPESFKLPDSEGTGMQWMWIDKTWRADLTNDGALVTRSRAKLTPDPGEDDGFVYYDNLWKRPASDYKYSKYTRRRRWVRTAELVTLDDPYADAAYDDSTHSVGDVTAGDASVGEVFSSSTPAASPNGKVTRFETSEGSTATESHSDSSFRNRKAT